MKRHYVGLDGLRGIAALAVMAMHEIGIFRPVAGPALHAGIAVDLFFMLSGFVLALAYDARLDRGMSWRTFMLARFVRLYPMIVLAISLAAAVALLRLAILHALPPGESFILLPPAFLLLPVGLFTGDLKAFSTTTALIPFCFPAWSLLFEFIISALFATRLRRLGAKANVILFALCALALIALTIVAGSVGVLGNQGSIGVPGGLFRVIVPFAIGVFLCRIGASDRLPRVPAGVPIVVAGALCLLPGYGGPLLDLACIFLIFPVLVALCAQPVSSPSARRVLDLMGALSYPIYLLHVPVAHIVGFVAKRLMPGVGSVPLIAASMASCVVVSYLALRVYDEPIRWLLTRKLRRAS